MAALDFPSSPTVGQIYTPAGGAPTYIWSGTAWSQVGQTGSFKLGSGVIGAVPSFDIPFPGAAGYTGGIELLLANVGVQAATDSVVARFSNDGTTFISTAAYRYAAMTVNDSGSPAQIASTAQTYIALTGTQANSAGFKSGHRLFFPWAETVAGQQQSVLWNGWYYNGTNIVNINGLGLNSSASGQGIPLAVRILTNSGSNFQAGARWQLNGFK